MAVPGSPRMQSRVGSRPSGLSAAHLFPQCLAMPGRPEGQREGGGVEKGSYHSSVTTLFVTWYLCMCVCLSACTLCMVTVRVNVPSGSCDRQHTEMVRSTDSGAREPGFRP